MWGWLEARIESEGTPRILFAAGFEKDERRAQQLCVPSVTHTADQPTCRGGGHGLRKLPAIDRPHIEH